ncbi:putative ankyrin repeat domain-containing protein 19 [Sciurus carolinensis]|uniref:putative ankyrin repeat domain-containing protein 19 n=1 Tax=Sciurus carolinensis TaxID=30640 RepID=UPI001FB24D1E|nr:putative ankyrin repeat domain-containing protein 19 [Sciurus carolinensis]
MSPSLGTSNLGDLDSNANEDQGSDIRDITNQSQHPSCWSEAMIHTYSQSSADSMDQFWQSLLPDLDVVATEDFSSTRSLCHNQLSWHMSNGHSPLLLAIKYKRELIVETLIQRKANIHAVELKGRTVLVFALEHESEHIAELLLQNGIDVSATDNSVQMALAFAAASDHSGMSPKKKENHIKLLMNQGKRAKYLKDAFC